MSFLNPYLLFGSLALAIPVLIHLVRREKSEIIPFSSLMFLLKGAEAIDSAAEDEEPSVDGRYALLILACCGRVSRAVSDPAGEPTAMRIRTRCRAVVRYSYSMRTAITSTKRKRASRSTLRPGDRMAIVAFNEMRRCCPPTSGQECLSRGRYP
jgi:hypothetical protein